MTRLTAVEEQTSKPHIKVEKDQEQAVLLFMRNPVAVFRMSIKLFLREGEGLPWCKHLGNFPLFWSCLVLALHCFEVPCCLGCSLFYVAGQGAFHRFLCRG